MCAIGCVGSRPRMTQEEKHKKKRKYIKKIEKVVADGRERGALNE